jgi:Zinc carboxypeptidase
MTPRPHHLGRYAELWQLDERWTQLARNHGGRAATVGHSAYGRPIRRYDFGAPEGPTVLLSALVHGVEGIGGLALLEAVRAFLGGGHGAGGRLVVLPVVNPDALAHNLERLGARRLAGRRCNGRGVDLNRNFGAQSVELPRHPLSGSRRRWSPHYTGPHAFSEPESRAVRDVALETRPSLALGFHSYGNLLLYPWAHTDAPNPRAPLYRALADSFCGAQPRERYTVKQAGHWYPIFGDMDDWLDATLGTLAFTVEVSRPERSWRDLGRLINPFWWMNPEAADEAIAEVVPGVCALLRDALARGRDALARGRDALARRPRVAA